MTLVDYYCFEKDTYMFVGKVASDDLDKILVAMSFPGDPSRNEGIVIYEVRDKKDFCFVKDKKDALTLFLSQRNDNNLEDATVIFEIEINDLE